MCDRESRQITAGNKNIYVLAARTCLLAINTYLLSEKHTCWQQEQYLWAASKSIPAGNKSVSNDSKNMSSGSKTTSLEAVTAAQPTRRPHGDLQSWRHKWLTVNAALAARPEHAAGQQAFN
jgi:hypothetical protein